MTWRLCWSLQVRKHDYFRVWLVRFQNLSCQSFGKPWFWLVFRLLPKTYQTLIFGLLNLWQCFCPTFSLPNFWHSKFWMSTKQASSVINISFMKNKERLNVENKENLLTYVSRFSWARLIEIIRPPSGRSTLASICWYAKSTFFCSFGFVAHWTVTLN